MTSTSATPRGRACSRPISFPGVEARDYQVEGLAAGSYEFVCTVHPNMTGTLTAS